MANSENAYLNPAIHVIFSNSVSSESISFFADSFTPLPVFRGPSNYSENHRPNQLRAPRLLLLPGGKDFDTSSGDPENSVEPDQRSAF